MITTRVKVLLPDHVKHDMDLFRIGEHWSVPQSYIDFHKDLAKSRIGDLQKDFLILAEGFERDGWCDGMFVVTLTALELKTGNSRKLRWHDGSQMWFVQTPGGGWTPVRLARRSRRG